MTAAAKVVLSIDDERAILSLREIILKLAGYEVFSALNGREGLKVFRLPCGRYRSP